MLTKCVRKKKSRMMKAHILNILQEVPVVVGKKSAYRPVLHGYIKITSKGMDFEPMVEIVGNEF